MFAYCNNNPCNYYDPYGDVLLPFPTIADYYAMHQMVQMLVVMEYGFAMEVRISSPYGFGRLDLFDAENNQYYEVKHAPQHQQFMASHQKMKYDNARVTGTMLDGYSFSGPPTPGTRTDISGSFQYQYWDVTYQSHGDGVITYEWALNEQRYNKHVGTVATFAGAAVAGMAYGQMGGNHKYQFSSKDFWY